MGKVTALEAKTRFGQLLARVERGEEVVITRHERPIARLIPEGGSPKPPTKAVAGLRALQRRIAARASTKPPLTLKEVRSAIEEGRR